MSYDVARDARARSARTLWQGLSAVVLAAIVAGLVDVLPGVQWTWGWWSVVLAGVGQAALTAALSYAARYLAPPA